MAVFLAATTFFFVLSVAPVWFGEELRGADNRDWVHKHGDGRGGVLNLAGNKTMLAWHYFRERQRQQQGRGEPDGGDGGDAEETGGVSALPLARGISGLPMSQTPALVGARHGTIRCEHNDIDGAQQLDELAYWNDPRGDGDVTFASPFAPVSPTGKRYLTFEPDR